MTNLCAVADVEALTQQTYSTTTKPTLAQVTQWVTDVSAEVEDWVGTKFASTTVTGEKHSGDGTVFLLLDNGSLITITSLVVDGATLTLGTDYIIEDAVAGFIEFIGVIPQARVEGSTVGHENIVVSYTYGNTTIPSYVKQFCAVRIALMAVGAATMAGSSSGSTKSYDDGDVSIQYADGSGLMQSLLLRYDELKRQMPRKASMRVA